MKHIKTGKKLGRKRGQRRALLNTLAVSLIQYGKIKTTETKAKELRPLIEKMITRSKKQNIQSIRTLNKRLPKESVYKLYHEISPQYKDRNGGYTRILKLAKKRINDGAKMAIIEFV